MLRFGQRLAEESLSYSNGVNALESCHHTLLSRFSFGIFFNILDMSDDN